VTIQKQKEWFQSALQVKGSVVPAVLGRSLIYGFLGLLVSYIHYRKGIPLHVPTLAALIPNVVLGLLLVFRTNTAYERFWEGRKLWGTLVNTVRNLARRIWLTVETDKPDEVQQKIAALRMLVAFCVAMKLHLRSEPINNELALLLDRDRYQELQHIHHPPLKVAFWVADYLQKQRDRGHIDPYQLDSLHQLLDTMVDTLGGCERILKTPMPLAYAVHLKQLLLLYCFSLPFQMVANLGWWTGLVTTLISFTLLGIEEIGVEIENPFGHDPNDLPLDAICATMLRNIENLIALSPDLSIAEAMHGDQQELSQPQY